jgi:hypothetical protein
LQADQTAREACFIARAAGGYFFDLPPILVAKWQVKKQIAYCFDAEGIELRRASRADAAQKLNRLIV